MLSARSSLPVPVSPSSTTGTADGASFWHKVRTLIIRGLLDAIRPSDVARFAFGGSAPLARTSSTEEPMRRRAPALRYAATMRVSPRYVPLVEPRSVASVPRSVRSIEA
jgi:hypothetical protein